MSDTLYLQLDQNIEVTNPHVYLQDIAALSMSDPKILNRLRVMPVIVLDAKKPGRYVMSVSDLLKKIQKENNTAVVMITHDLGVVAEMCSRVVVMYAGRIVEEAPVQELFADPKHPYTQGLIGSVPKLGSGVESLPSIPGSVPDLSVMPKGCKFAPRCKYAMDICHQQEPELADINEAGTRKCRCHLLNKTGKEA